MSTKFRDPKIVSALGAVRAAEREALATIAAAYPVGCEVLVRHYRGEFSATVEGHCCTEWSFHHLGYVSVRNHATGKSSRRYYTDLEVL